MDKTILYKEKSIHYRITGKGHCLVLLHGFIESLDIWDSFVAELKKDFCIITIDLPGHGQSDCIGEVHRMEEMAEVVRIVLQTEKIQHCILCGHSMGGYVALSFLDLFPQMLNAVCLFHSNANADSKEAGQNRMRTIELIKQNKHPFLSAFIPDLFAPENIEPFSNEIEILKERALQISPESLIASIRGMMQRKDHSKLIHHARIPFLFIIGKQDSRSSFKQVIEQAQSAHHAEILLLDKVGHMGYIENKKTTLRVLKDFSKAHSN
ncbi:MAG: alpha/beta fold hydrolase [Bacteroidota bacterium]